MIEIGTMKQGEGRETYELIVRVFHKAVAPFYSEKGAAKFLGMISPGILGKMSREKHSFVIVARDRPEIVGMLAVINDSHVVLIFVDPLYQGKGVGRNLVAEAIQNCLQRGPELSEITVSSSPNSKTFYETVGFEATGAELDEDGMRFTPMRKTIKHPGSEGRVLYTDAF